MIFNELYYAYNLSISYFVERYFNLLPCICTDKFGLDENMTR